MRRADGRRHALVICGSLSGPTGATFPDRLHAIHDGLKALLARHQPDCVAIEDIFHHRNVRSALKLGQARGVALLAASEAGLPVVPYAPAAVKRAVVGYGRAEKQQVQQMVKLLLGLAAAADPARRRRRAGGRDLPPAGIDRRRRRRACGRII